MYFELHSVLEKCACLSSDLLSRYKLWTVTALVINLCPLNAINEISQVCSVIMYVGKVGESNHRHTHVIERGVSLFTGLHGVLARRHVYTITEARHVPL